MTIPPEAVNAAAKALARGDCPPFYRARARIALEAAAPLIVADVLARVEQGIADGAAEVIAQAVAAERERIRQLAEGVGASYQLCRCDPAKGIGVPNHGPVPFADLLASTPESSPIRCCAPACEI